MQTLQSLTHPGFVTFSGLDNEMGYGSAPGCTGRINHRANALVSLGRGKKQHSPESLLGTEKHLVLEELYRYGKDEMLKRLPGCSHLRQFAEGLTIHELFQGRAEVALGIEVPSMIASVLQVERSRGYPLELAHTHIMGTCDLVSLKRFLFEGEQYDGFVLDHKTGRYRVSPDTNQLQAPAHCARAFLGGGRILCVVAMYDEFGQHTLLTAPFGQEENDAFVHRVTQRLFPAYQEPALRVYSRGPQCTFCDVGLLCPRNREVLDDLKPVLELGITEENVGKAYEFKGHIKKLHDILGDEIERVYDENPGLTALMPDGRILKKVTTKRRYIQPDDGLRNEWLEIWGEEFVAEAIQVEEKVKCTQDTLTAACRKVHGDVKHANAQKRDAMAIAEKRGNLVTKISSSIKAMLPSKKPEIEHKKPTRPPGYWLNGD